MMYSANIMHLGVVNPRVSAGRILRICGAMALMVSLAACGSTSGGKSGSGAGTQRGAYKIGNPYKIDGVTYTPQETFTLVETGVASWYGPGFHGKATANGERYDQSDRTAAHRTLQMPSVVRVTNLDNGQSTIVRVNDRGPFARNRIIDLSRTAAQEIDMIGRGTARVRVEQLQAESLTVKEVAISGGGPSAQHDALAQLAAGRRGMAAPAPTQVAAVAQPAAAPPPTPVQAGWPTNPRHSAVPAAAPATNGGPTIASLASAPVTSAGSGFYVQVGAFSTAENAERRRGDIRSYGNSEVSQASTGGRDVYRVRLGPYTTTEAAGIVADRLKRSGYGDARVVAD